MAVAFLGGRKIPVRWGNKSLCEHRALYRTQHKSRGVIDDDDDRGYRG
jgi:hypothetical protein